MLIPKFESPDDLMSTMYGIAESCVPVTVLLLDRIACCRESIFRFQIIPWPIEDFETSAVDCDGLLKRFGARLRVSELVCACFLSGGENSVQSFFETSISLTPSATA